MPYKLSLLLLLTISLLTACQPTHDSEDNPPASGFDIEGSDHHAILLADEVMGAMGGREAWDSTRYLQWNFFGFRSLTWDKERGDVRIEVPGDSITYLLNINTLQGKVKRRGEVVSNPDTLKTLLAKGKSIWINDSYWLVMPFKLKDSGVTLKHMGKDTTADGRPAEVLQLTFKNVGDTPQNKYLVYVNQESKLISQWAYFKEASQNEPNFTTPWKDYNTYGKILLSGDRGERKLTSISAPEQLPKEIFTKFE